MSWGFGDSGNHRFRCGYGTILLVTLNLLQFEITGSSTTQLGSQGFDAGNFQLPSYEADQPWIGSHTLNFSPNPFLTQNINERKTTLAEPPVIIHQVVPSVLTLSDSSGLSSTATPSHPVVKNNTKSRGSLYGLRGRRKNETKIKVGSRFLQRNKKFDANSRATASKLYQTRKRRKVRKGSRLMKYSPPPMNEMNFTESKLPIVPDNEFNRAKLEFLPIDQAGIDPLFLEKQQHPTERSMLSQPNRLMKPPTTPILIAFTTPDTTLQTANPQNPGLVDQDNQNPSYFRNVILKAMMDKLTEAGVVTHAPMIFIHTTTENITSPTSPQN